VYLDAEDLLAAANSGVATNSSSTVREDRPYVLANPQFVDLPSLGSSDTSTNLEQMMVINPQVIFMLGSASGNVSGNMTRRTAASADDLQAKTGIPVIAVVSGSIDSDAGWEQMYSAFRFMGKTLNRNEKADELIAYIQTTLADLDERTRDIPESERKTAYVGGLGHSGAHGMTSTQPSYPPFAWLNVKNVAGGYDQQYVEFSKESLIHADPDFIFLDANSLAVQDEIGGFDDIKSPIFADMKAVKSGNVYGTFAYIHSGSHLETALADAYFIGKTIYPDRFDDVDPEKKADEIFTMFVGKPVFDQMKTNCNNVCFARVPVT
jgi:iron complex transport system substrate-binding protein